MTDDSPPNDIEQPDAVNPAPPKVAANSDAIATPAPTNNVHAEPITAPITAPISASPGAPEIPPQAPKQLPSWDEAAAQLQQQKKPALPTWDEAVALSKPPPPGFAALELANRFFPDVMPMGPQKAGAEAFMGGLTHMNWSDEFAKTMREAGIFNDYAKGQWDINRGVLEGLVMPAMHLTEGAVNLFPAAIAGGQAAILEAGKEADETAIGQAIGAKQIARDIASLPEAFPLFGEELGLRAHPPHVDKPRPVLNGKKPVDPVVIDKAQVEKAIGTTEAQYAGLEPLTPEQENQVIDAQNRLIATGREDIPPRDIHTVVRQQNPALFNEYDGLSTQRDTLGRWLTDERERLGGEARVPFEEQIADLNERMDDATPRLQKKYEARIEELTAKADEAARDAAMNHPAIQRIRQAYFETDNKMRDMAVDVSKAYRDAQEQLGTEAVEHEPVKAGQDNVVPPEAAAEVPKTEPTTTVPIPPTAVAGVVGEGAVKPGQRLPEENDKSFNAKLDQWENQYRSMSEDDRHTDLGRALNIASRPFGVLGTAEEGGGPLTINGVEGIKAAREAGREDIVDALVRRAKNEASHARSTADSLGKSDPAFERMSELAAERESLAEKVYEEAATKKGTPTTAEADVAPGTQAATATESAKPQYVAEVENHAAERLMAAGLPEPEARATAQIVAAYYETRAARFGGQRGTAADLYNAESPEIRGEVQKQALELAQKNVGKEYGQSPTEIKGNPEGEAEDSAWRRQEPEQTKDGKFKGAPDWVKNRRGLSTLRRLIKQLVDEGAPGRFWYEDSAKKIMQITGGDLQKAEKLTGLVAIYSPQTPVFSNMNFAIKAYEQWKRGEKVKVKTGIQDAKAQAWLENGQDWGGRKVNSFYLNLMHDIVTEHPEAIKDLNIPDDVLSAVKKATVDLWVLRALGYDVDAAGGVKEGAGNKYGFAENEIQRAAGELNQTLPDGAARWLPHQVQAALWSAIKARFELPGVKEATWAESLKKGFSKMVADENGVEHRTAPDKNGPERQAHMAVWRKHALAASPEDVARQVQSAKGSFGDAIDRVAQNVTWEAIPSTQIGAEINSGSPEVRKAFTREALSLITDDDGNDVLAAQLGVNLNYNRPSVGAYAGEINPNVVTTLVPEKPAGIFDATKAQQYARAIQYIYKQDAVPYFRADSAADFKGDFSVVGENGRTLRRFDTQREAQEFADKQKGKNVTVKGGKFAHGVHLQFDKDLDADTEKQVLQALNEHLGPDAGYTKTGPREVAVINYRGDDGLPFKDDEEFFRGINSLEDKSGRELGLAKINEFGSEGQYGPVHDWKADPTGAPLSQAVGGSPDLQSWVLDRQQAFDSLLAKWSGDELAAREREAGAAGEAVEPAKEFAQGGVERPLPKNFKIDISDGGMITARMGNKIVGKLIPDVGDRAGTVFKVAVDAPFQRMGVARAMYRAAEEKYGAEFKPSKALTDEGFEFWKRFRPEAVANDLRMHRDDLIGASVTSTSGRVGKIEQIGTVGAIAKFDDMPEGETNSTFYVPPKEVQRIIADKAEREFAQSAKNPQVDTPDIGNSGEFNPKSANILEQAKRGKIRILENGRNVITLLKESDASTALHEFGHQWLEDLLEDAKHPLAPDQLKADAATVRSWLKMEEDEAPKTSQHEKFARGWERYAMEGIAPSKALASVFAQFKTWLTKIYDSYKALKSPINDDIRRVFDRMLAEKPERTVIAPEREPAETFADIHESDAATTPPHMAGVAAENMRSEIDEIAETNKDKLPPGTYEKLVAAGRPEPVEGENAGAAGGADGTKPEPGIVSPAAQPRTVPEIGNQPAPKSPDVGGAASEGGGPAVSGSPWGARTGTAPAGSAKQLKDLAGNINLNLLNMDEDARTIVRNLAAANSDFNDVRFGTAAYQQAMINRASDAVLEMTSKAAADAYNKWKLSDSEADAEQFVVASQRVLLAAKVNAELRASASRSLSAFKRTTKRGPNEDFLSFIKRSAGKTLFQLKEEGDLMEALDTTDQKANFLADSRSTRYQKIRSGILSYFINNLISGPVTHAAYSIGNTTWSLFKAGTITPAAASIDAMREYIAGAPLEDRVYFREVPAQLYGLVRGFRDALPAAGRALKTGVPYMKGADVMALREGEEAPSHGARLQAIPGKVGYVLETPSRSVTAIHTVYYSANYEAEIARRAVRTAIRENLSGDAFNARVADFTANPPDADVAGAHTEALKMVLMEKPPFDSSMSSLQRAVNNNMAAKIVMPFMQVGTNILKGGLVEMTPLGPFISKDVRRNLFGDENGKIDPIARSTQIAKIAVGTTAAIATVGLAMEGIITGGGPADPNERRVWMKAGHVPYAIHIGDEWIPYRKFLGPLGPLISASADMYEIGHAAGTEGYTKAGAALIFGLSEVVFDESWFSGLSNFIGAARDYNREGDRYLRNLAMDFLPFSIGMSQVSRMIDPYQREARTWIDSLRAHVPFISQQNTPMVDILGEPIPSHSMVTPLNVPPDPVAEAMQKVGFAPALPQRRIAGQMLDGPQYYEYAQKAGRIARERLNAAVMSPGWEQIPPDLRKAEMKRIFETSRQEARAIVIAESIGKPNDISARAVAAADARAKALQGIH